MHPSFSDLTYFVEVADKGNISRASERLGITQPTLSSAIQRLEAAIGSQLLIRSRTGVQLTKSGAELLNRSRELISSWEKIKADVSRKETEVTGHFVIGCHVSVGLYSLPHFLPSLMQEFPDLNVELVHGLSRKITEMVVSFEVDIGIVVNPVEHPDLVIKPLCKDVVTFWTASKMTQTQDLDGDEAILICDSNLAQSQKLISDLSKRKIKFKRTIHAPSLEVVAELTRAGAGIGVLPTRVAQRTPNLKKASADGRTIPTFNDEVCCVYRPDFQRSVAAKVILDRIRTAVR